MDHGLALTHSLPLCARAQTSKLVAAERSARLQVEAHLRESEQLTRAQREQLTNLSRKLEAEAGERQVRAGGAEVQRLARWRAARAGEAQVISRRAC